MNMCDYGCGQESKYQFKNGKRCCSEYIAKCPKIIKTIKEKNKGKKRSLNFRKNISEKMMGSHNHMYGTKGYWFGKKRTNSVIQKFRISHRISIDEIQNRHPFFSQIEEMRYNPDKPGEKEIQVHCKNHNCPNSKEQGGWFTSTKIQLYERIRALERPYGMIENNFYCSDVCKQECPLYGIKSDPYRENKKLYTQEEYQTFRKYVLQRDNFNCQYCEEKAEHVHHERPQKVEPFFSLDPDLAWSVCKDCHYKKAHKDDCSTGKLAIKICP